MSIVATITRGRRRTVSKLENWKDKLAQGLAWRLPRRVVYFAAVRVMAHATQGGYGDQVVPELSAVDALKRWEGGGERTW